MQAFALAYNSLMLAMVHHGFGHHLMAIPTADRTIVLLLFWLAQICFKISVHLTKISLIMLYMGIFGTVQWYRNLSLVLIGILSLYVVVAFITGLFQCNPIPKSWTMDLEGKCITNIYFFIFNAAFGLGTDIVVLLLPFPILLGLKLRVSQKLALLPVFGLGIFIVVISAVRLAALASNLKTDVTYDLRSNIWTISEMNVAIICACLPMIRVLFIRLFPQPLASRSHVQWDQPLSSCTSKQNKGGWSQAKCNYGINVTNVSRGGANDSEEYIIQNQPVGIHKTMHYQADFERNV
jgi:hypothetical protein